MDDANELIGLANQMGFFDDKVQKYTPNASRCLTKSAIMETNREKHGQKRVLRLTDIYGMLLILSVGLAGGLMGFAAEHIAHKRHILCNKISRDRRKNLTISQIDGNKSIALAIIEKCAEIELDKPPKLKSHNSDTTVLSTGHRAIQPNFGWGPSTPKETEYISLIYDV